MTPEQLMQADDYAIGLELPEISVYLSWGTQKGHRQYMNYVAFKEGNILFKGDDYSPSPAQCPDGLDSAVQCLAFLCVQPGDTDDAYFVKYTPKQKVWAKSCECEQVKGIISDYEQGEESEYYGEAYETLFHAIVK